MTARIHPVQKMKNNKKIPICKLLLRIGFLNHRLYQKLSGEPFFVG
jgi:hypothetical protein